MINCATSRLLYFAKTVIPCFQCFRDTSRPWHFGVRGALIWLWARPAFSIVRSHFILCHCWQDILFCDFWSSDGYCEM
jgi:hypothetical protein